MSRIGTWGRFCKNIGETFEDAEPSKIYKWWNSIDRKRKGTVIRTATINPVRSQHAQMFDCIRKIQLCDFTKKLWFCYQIRNRAKRRCNKNWSIGCYYIGI